MPQYLLAMTIFGTIGLFVKFIELPSTVIALSRGALGTLFLLLVLKLLKRRINTATRSIGDAFPTVGIETFKKTYQYGDCKKQL